MAEGSTEIKVVGRTIGRNERGFYWEEDSTHRDVLLEERRLGVLQWSFHSCGNNRAMRGRQGEYARFRCNHVPHECRPLNYLAQDRPDIAFAANFLARSMAHPRVGDEVRMKRVHQVFKGSPPLPLEFCLPEMPKQVTVLSDSDWAGDQATRRSTSGVMIFHGAHFFAVRKPFAEDGGPSALAKPNLTLRSWACLKALEFRAYVKSGALALNLHAFATAARLVELRVVRGSAE